MQATSAGGFTLPDLRSDLRLHEGSPDRDGGASWLVYDPVRHRYFQLDQESCDLLSIWSPIDIAAFTKRASEQLHRPVAQDEVQALVTFLFANNLTIESASGDALAFAKQAQAGHQTMLSRVTRGYLFFKVPLFRPQRFLEATVDIVAPLYTRTAFWMIAILTLIGLYLTSRQWDTFATTFLDLISVEGAFYYALSLVFVKSMHELGHAYTATRYGVRVNTMGVAFMLMMPLLFTDVTDAWKLRSKRQKLAIAAAGMVVELAIAGIATFLWAFLPDGPSRSIAFILATTSWILSITVNLNPFMRFDGYYILSDACGIANMQSRGFEMAKWALRELLFGLGHPPPEHFKRTTRNWMVVYGVCMWIYRLSLYIGIALVVYHFFIKVLGVALFAVEMIFFICVPILNELRVWWGMRKEIMSSRRKWITSAVALALVAVAVVPWSGTIEVPAVAVANTEFSVFAPRAAKVTKLALHDGEAVEKGQRLAVLAAPDLDHEIETTRLSIDLAQARLRRIAGDIADRTDLIVLRAELARDEKKLAGLENEQQRLVLKAPFKGSVRDVMPGLAAGDWVNEKQPIARVVSEGGRLAQGYIHEDNIWQVKVGQSAVFVPEDPLLARRKGHVVWIASTGARNIEIPALASVYGGAIAADKDKDGAIRPRSGRYLIKIKLDGKEMDRVVRGTLLLDGKSESFAAAAWRRVLQVLVRESGV